MEGITMTRWMAGLAGWLERYWWVGTILFVLFWCAVLFVYAQTCRGKCTL